MKLKPCYILFFIIFMLTIRAGFAQQICTKWGPYVKTVHLAKNNAELMMADVMMPSDGLIPYTYACSVQFRIGKSGGYCGIQLKGPTEGIPNNIFSIWDFPNKVQLIAAYKDPLTLVDGFGGEGTGIHSHADFGWKPDQWYTNIVRRWSGKDSTTMVGYWIYEHTSKTYKHYVTFAVPEKDAMLHGDLASFLENFADRQNRSRVAMYKSYWMLNDRQQWIHPDSLVAEAGEGAWKAEKYGDDGVRVTACGTMPWLPKTLYAVKQPDRPQIISANVYDMAAYYNHTTKSISLAWSLLPTATPQLSYEVQVFDNRAYSGKPLATSAGTDPDLTSIDIPAGGLNLKNQNYYVTLLVTDIFGQKSPIKKAVLRELKP